MNKRGMTLIEVLVALAIVMIAFFVMASGMTQLKKMTADSMILSDEDKQIMEIIETLRSSSENMQITYTADTLDEKNLPMAWGQGQTGAASLYPSLPGRYGFTIKPSVHLKGIYEIDILVTHIKWSSVKNYKFIVSGK